MKMLYIPKYEWHNKNQRDNEDENYRKIKSKTIMETDLLNFRELTPDLHDINWA